MNEEFISKLRSKIQDEGNNILDEILANPNMATETKQRKMIVAQLLHSFSLILSKL